MNYLPGLASNHDLPELARIIGVNHLHPAVLVIFEIRSCFMARPGWPYVIFIFMLPL
jgi:hypothetical protein